MAFILLAYCCLLLTSQTWVSQSQSYIKILDHTSLIKLLLYSGAGDGQAWHAAIHGAMKFGTATQRLKLGRLIPLLKVLKIQASDERSLEQKSNARIIQSQIQLGFFVLFQSLNRVHLFATTDCNTTRPPVLTIISSTPLFRVHLFHPWTKTMSTPSYTISASSPSGPRHEMKSSAVLNTQWEGQSLQ